MGRELKGGVLTAICFQFFVGRKINPWKHEKVEQPKDFMVGIIISLDMRN
jgi:hypothetical protein